MLLLLFFAQAYGFVPFRQGWEFAHRFSEQIAGFLRKNERPERFAHIAHFL